MANGENKPKTGRIILLRHGRSKWNDEDRFTGWYDSPLIQMGKEQAVEAGELLAKNKFKPDVVFTTSLSRASETGEIALEALGITGEEAKSITRIDDRIVERHYGDLTGKNKAEVMAELKERHGEEEGKKIFLKYRRSYLNPPPIMEDGHTYKDQILTIEGNSSNTESLQGVVKRVDEFWKEELLPRLQNGENILLSAHGNSMRALSKIINGIDDKAIETYEMDNAKPIVFDITPSKDLQSWQVIEQKFSSKDKLQALLDQISTKDGGKGYAKIEGEINNSNDFKQYHASGNPKEANKFYKSKIEITYARSTGEENVRKNRDEGVVSAVALIKNLHEQGIITGNLPDNFNAGTLSAELKEPRKDSHKHHTPNPIAVGDNAEILIGERGHVKVNIKVTGDAAYTKNIDEKLDKALSAEISRKAGDALDSAVLEPERVRKRG